jgi:hypothetical protein
MDICGPGEATIDHKALWSGVEGTGAKKSQAASSWEFLEPPQDGFREGMDLDGFSISIFVSQQVLFNRVIGSWRKYASLCLILDPMQTQSFCESPNLVQISKHKKGSYLGIFT